jgi:hypothetical protein
MHGGVCIDVHGPKLAGNKVVHLGGKIAMYIDARVVYIDALPLKTVFKVVLDFET